MTAVTNRGRGISAKLLYAIDAVILLDTDGNRLLSKYYSHESELFANKKKQDAFEGVLFNRTRRSLNSSCA